MATTPFSSFLPGILVDVPGCPDFAVEREIRNAAIEFCRESLVWRQQLDPIPVISGIGVYELASVAMTSRVVRIYDAIFTDSSGNKTQLIASTVQELDDKNPSWRVAQDIVANPLPSMATRYYTQETPDSISLAGVPVVAGSIQILGCLVPTRTATDMDAWVADEYYDAIIHGAKSRLFSVPQKPWSDGGLAQYHRSEFENWMNKAATVAAKSFQANAPIHTKTYLR